jgi:gas vesicle protein
MSEAGLAAGLAVGVAGAVGGGAVGACACIVSANKVSRQTDDKFLKTMEDCSEKNINELFRE